MVKTLFFLQDECIRLSGELAEVLRLERRSLIEWRIEILLTTTAQKEDLMHQLREVRRNLKGITQGRFGVEKLSDVSKFLSPEMALLFLEKESQWEKAWNELKVLCEVNQQFMEHSQKNLTALMDNWKRLTGEQPTYSQKGEKVEKNLMGRMVEKSL